MRAEGFEWQTAVAHLEACQLWLRLRFALHRRQTALSCAITGGASGRLASRVFVAN